MLMMAVAPPAIVQPAAVAPRSFGAFVEALEEVAEAFIDGRESELPALVVASRKAWEHAKRNHASVLADGEIQAIDRGLDALAGLKPRFMAESALGLGGTILGHMRPSRNRARLVADAATMLAWCRVEARAWDQVPNVAEAFQPYLDQCGGHRAPEVRRIHDYLGVLQDDLANRSVTGAKRDLRRLLELLDQAERN
ncbi:hypothetical protein [Mesoterricola silvestris]|uniref:Uncharacterized protein n=1 Tax=Mesoterricola silvestris TaxID=2927979 RepID=A0AA48GZG6_9BACT|nr:hypothetical protein [Mesoterricola silvestris]BDU73213.1 hypothetical protein METEAL_23870 [Mesoterricola silvestris]